VLCHKTVRELTKADKKAIRISVERQEKQKIDIPILLRFGKIQAQAQTREGAVSKKSFLVILVRFPSGQHFAHRLSYVFMKTLDCLTTVAIQRLHEENQSSGRYSRPRFDR